jgi:hypothetical protein
LIYSTCIQIAIKPECRQLWAWLGISVSRFREMRLVFGGTNALRELLKEPQARSPEHGFQGLVKAPRLLPLVFAVLLHCLVLGPGAFVKSVEAVFGQIKEARGIRAFLLRGLKK